MASFVSGHERVTLKLLCHKIQNYRYVAVSEIMDALDDVREDDGSAENLSLLKGFGAAIVNAALDRAYYHLQGDDERHLQHVLESVLLIADRSLAQGSLDLLPMLESAFNRRQRVYQPDSMGYGMAGAYGMGGGGGGGGGQNLDEGAEHLRVALIKKFAEVEGFEAVVKLARGLAEEESSSLVLGGVLGLLRSADSLVPRDLVEGACKLAMDRHLAMPAAQFRRQHKDARFRILDLLSGILGRDSEAFCHFFMAFSLKCFRIEAFEERLVGVELLKKVCQETDEHMDPVRERWLTAEVLVDWLRANDVLTDLLKMQTEVVSRSTQLVLFYLEHSGEGEVTRLWKSSLGQDEALGDTIQQVLVEALGHLT